MKNIVIFTNSLLIGGAEKQSVLLAKSLCTEYKIFLVVFYGNHVDNKYLEIINNYPINIYRMHGNMIFKAFDFYSFLNKNNIEVIFSFLATTNFYSAIVGILANVSYRIGGIRSSQLSPIKFLIQRFLHNHFLTYSIFNNYSGAESLMKKGFNANKILIFPNCFDLLLPQIIHQNNNIIQIITVARFVKEKDFPTAIETIHYIITKLLGNTSIKVHYSIIGYGKLEEKIRNLISSYNLEEFITLFINPSSITDYFKNADIYLSTSLFEGTSNSLLEAMSYSLPIVATDAGDNSLLVDNNKSGYICEIRNVKQLSECLFALVSNQEQRLRFGLNAYNKLKKEYSLDVFKKNYIDLISSIK